MRTFAEQQPQPREPAARGPSPARRAVPSVVDEVVHSSGVPLDPAVRAGAEARLGVDFSRVRVHADETAGRSAEAVRARAWTVGPHVAFAPGQYQPRSPAGERLLLHELVHVAQQGPDTGTATAPRSMTGPQDASEREARALADHGAGATPSRITGRLGPVMARFDTSGARRQRQRSEAIQHGLDPDDPASRQEDPLAGVRREAEKDKQPPPPEKVQAGDRTQQAHAVRRIDPADLLLLPRIQSRLKTLTDETEARERSTVKPGGQVTHTAANMVEYWSVRFVDSVEYILYKRRGDRRAAVLKQLRTEEDKLIKAAPADLEDKVKALRESFHDAWEQEAERAADRYLVVAANEGRFLTEPQAAAPVSIYGLPAGLESEVTATDAPGQVNKGSKPVTESVAQFMKAVQKESGLKAVADNYTDHEKHSPYLGNIEGVGKYSFDVDLGGLIKTNAEGFYEREPLVKFFLAVARAGDATKIAWVALYNDFEVAKTVNEKLGKHRIGFSGGGSAGPGQEGSIHHGPAPYILHVHFNIMPTALAAQYLAAKGGATPPHIDLGGPD
jgi:hypothetical protein